MIEPTVRSAASVLPVQVDGDGLTKISEPPVQQQIAAVSDPQRLDLNKSIAAIERAAASSTQDPVQDAADASGRDPAFLLALADMANENLKRFSRDIEFSVDAGTEQVVVKVIDRQTQELIRQIPPDAVLKLMETMEEVRGVIFRDEV